MRKLRMACATILAAVIAIPSLAQAQQRTLRVISSDSLPVVYAYVTINGGNGQVTDEKGELSLGAGKKSSLSLSVRRIGFQQWFGKIDLPDTAVVMTVTLVRTAQLLAEVHVTDGARGGISVPMQRFYDRWMLRQKGLLTATFIGPEEIESRHPDRITNLLNGLNGVSFRRTGQNDMVAFGNNGTCQMAVLVDGIRQCPARGCNTEGGSSNAGKMMARRDTTPLNDQTAVTIDRILDANSVSAIEVYTRGGNIPSSLYVADAACGVIAFWTGSRRP